MIECKDCELAIYCYSDPSTWIFRTKQEMDEKQAAMVECPVKKLRSRSSSEIGEAVRR